MSKLLRPGMTKTVLMVIAFLTGLFFVVVLAGSARATDSNQVEFWCDDGVKFEPIGTPSYTVPPPPDGFTWTLLVLKAGTVSEEFPNPIPGQSYTPSNGKEVSHAILCMEPTPSETTTTTSTTTTSTTTTTTTSTTTTTTTSTTTTTTTTVPETTTTTNPETTATTEPPPETTTTTSSPDDPSSDPTTTTTQPSATATTEAPPVGGVAAGGGGMFGTGVNAIDFWLGVGFLALAAALLALSLGRRVASRRE